MKAKLEMVVLVEISWLVKVLFLLYRAAPLSVPFAGIFYLMDGLPDLRFPLRGVYLARQQW